MKLFLRASSLAALALVAGAAVASANQDARVANAARQRDTAAIRALVKTADVNGTLPDGATALHWAAYWDDADTVDLLLRSGA